MKPILFHIELPLLGLSIPVLSAYMSISIALATAIYLGNRASERIGLPPDKALKMTLWGLLMLFVGARLFSLAEHPSLLLSNPLSVLELWDGRWATYGGAVGGVLGCALYLRSIGQPVMRFLDAFVPYGFLGLAIIRVGDFLNGTAFGTRTDVPWAVEFPKGSFAHKYHLHHGWIVPEAPRALPVHPTALYEAAVAFLLFLFLRFIYPEERRFSGERFLLGGLLYVAGRFGVDFLREDLRRTPFLGLASTQLTGLACAVVLLIIAFWLHHRWRAAYSQETQSHA